jgi:hypothetical protein
MQDDQTVLAGEYPDVGWRISKAFSIYASYPIPFLIISLINLPITVISGLWVWGAIFLIPGFIVQEIASGAGAVAAYAAIRGSSPDAGTSLSAAVNKLGRLIELSLRTIGAFLLLAITIIGIPWAFRLIVRWFFGYQVVMLHDAEPKAAISESCRLVDGDWWRVFGNFLLVGLIIGVPSFALRVAIGGTAGIIVSALVSIIAGPLFMIFQTLFYLRLLQEKGLASEAPPVLT